MTLQDCRPLAAIIVRLQGEGMADLLYADSLPSLHGFGYMKILWLHFQLEVAKVQSLSCAANTSVCRQSGSDVVHACTESACRHNLFGAKCCL